ncbi:MAG TPA: glycosyltransferase 87 family protein [Ktedonobacterales bacterium]|nr:glycosyltransferase 87 family protein [Ktedonobacterales bacterium]
MSRVAANVAHETHGSDGSGAFLRWARHWIVVPRAGTTARLTLVALALVLQNLLELPRTVFSTAIGLTLTSILVVALLAVSIVLLLAAVGSQPPRWRWPYRRGVQILALCLTLAVVPLGIAQCVKIGVASFSAPQYSNDGTTLDHYAAQQLIEGHNPYAASNIVDAVRFLHQDSAFTTPLMRGAFANRAPSDYPTEAERRAVFAQQADHPGGPVEFESQVSYPALAFLSLVPFVWAGLPSVVLFFALCLLALAIVLIRGAPAETRLWLLLLLLADTPLLNATLVGDLDVFYILLLFVAWRWLRRPLVSTIAFGLALAAKQLAWFFAPFYLLLVWRRCGGRAALRRLAGGVAIFAAMNAPFFINNPGAWLHGVLAPQLDPMFPLGTGLVRLSLAGVLPLPPAWVYLALEALAIVACLLVYWRERRPEAGTGFVLPVLPLWFAWRSLTTYFYFVTLPALTLALHDGADDGADDANVDATKDVRLVVGGDAMGRGAVSGAVPDE